MMREMVARELMRNRLRTALTVLGVAIGILLIVSLSSISEGINVMVNQEIGFTTGLISVIHSGIDFQNIFYSQVDEDLVQEFSTIPGVDDTSGFIMGFADVGWVGGIDFDKMDLFSGFNVDLDDGRWPESGAGEVALGPKAAKSFGVSVGDSIKIDGKEYEVTGISRESEGDTDSAIITSIATAQDILGMEGKVTMIVVSPANVADSRDIADYINEVYSDSDDVVAGTDEDVRKFAAQMTGQLSAMTFGLGSIASIIAGIVIMNVMFMTVRERRREIGVMKAIGATNRQVLVEIVSEAIAISLAGAAIGLFLSMFSVDFLNIFLGSRLAIITPGLVTTSVLFALFIGIAAGIAPARRAAMLNPIEAIRYE